jgi:hypothetical protein
MLKFARKTTWNFTFKKRASATAAFDDLNGYKIFFTIKPKLDTEPTDKAAVYKDSVTVATSITYHTFTVLPTNTDLDPGQYYYGFRFVKDGVEESAD